MIKPKAILMLVFLLFPISLFAQNTTKFQLSVLDENGKFISDLKPSDIQIQINKQTAQIRSLRLKKNESLDVFFLIDISVSQERVLPDEKRAVEGVIDKLLIANKDRVAIASFDVNVGLEQDLTGDFPLVKKQLGGIKIKFPPGYIGGGIFASQEPVTSNLSGSTSIWTCLKKVLTAFASIDAGKARRVLILITDGVSTSGEGSRNDVIDLASKTNIPIYAIGIGDESYSGVDKGNLKTLSSNSGGMAIFPKKENSNLNELITSVEASFHNYYEVELELPVTKLSTRQDIKIEFSDPASRKRKFSIIASRILIQ